MNTEQPTTSTEKPSEASVTNEEQLIDPFIEFECHVCQMTEKCLFGELNVVDGKYVDIRFSENIIVFQVRQSNVLHARSVQTTVP